MRFGIDSDGWLYKLDSNDGSPPLLIRPLPQAYTQALITPWSTIEHSEAGSGKTNWTNLHTWWQRPEAKGTEAHTVTELDGTVAQFMPFTRRADCNFKANGWYAGGQYVGAISDESQDLGSGTLSSTPWWPEQLESKAQVRASLNVKYGIPLVACPGPFDRGIGYHSQYAPWSAYVGKTCPGAARIAQMGTLIERAQQIVADDRPVVIVPQPSDPPAGGDIVITVFQPTDCLAQFIAVCDKNGNALEVRWISSAKDQAVRDNHLAAGARVDRGDCTKGRFRNCVLRGPVPHGDAYAWTPDDFWLVAA